MHNLNMLWWLLGLQDKNPIALVLVRPHVDFCLITRQPRPSPLWISRRLCRWSMISSAISRSLHVLSLLGGLPALGATSSIPRPPGPLMSFSIELKSGLCGEPSLPRPLPWLWVSCLLHSGLPSTRAPAIWLYGLAAGCLVCPSRR